MKILIVEDSKTQAEKLSSILEDNGYQVEVASNGKDALNKINDYKPDIILSDIMMPEMNGYELCKVIRENPALKNITFILLTTLSDVEDIIYGLECGANYIITKPYNEEYLLKQIRSVIDIKSLRETDDSETNVKIQMNGHQFTIAAKKAQIVDFLISIYDAAVQKHKELYNTRLELEELNAVLEQKVDERTAALKKESEERKSYEHQFFEAQKLESIGKLTGGIAHDFNNLLLIALGNLEILTNSMKQDSGEISHVHQAIKALERGSALTKHLLSFARKQSLFPKSVSISDHLNNIITLLKPALGERIKISTSYADNIWPIWIDPIQFENAIMNIAINARDAMNNTGELHFDISNISISKNEPVSNNQPTPGDYVKITITDHGCGMPKDIVDKIFEPFFTTKKVGSGTGLGLSMVYGFIKQSQGTISVQSTVGHGTTFNLFLPRSYIVSDRIDETSSPVIKSVNGSEVILIAEDEKSILELVSMYLSQLGYKVITAQSGNEALAVIKSGKAIDLLFTDVIMPGEMTGKQLALEASIIAPKIKILLTSGYTNDVLTNDEPLPSIIQHLSKPYKLEVLASKLRSILDNQL